MTKLNRRDFLESSAGAAAASTTLGMGAMAVSPAVQAQNLSFKPEKVPSFASCAGAALCKVTLTPTWPMSRNSRKPQVLKFVLTMKVGKTSAPKRPWLPTRARALTSFCRPTTMPICTQRNCSTSQICAITWAKNTVASSLHATPT